jgi:hypothetical protein
VIRIANGQGFWGDWLEAPVRLVEQGPIDYLTLDYLAEVTMAILQKQRQRDPSLGYARDFQALIARIAPRIAERGIKVLANAGGLNPVSCAREVRRLAPRLKVAVVLGDDIASRVGELLARGHILANMDTLQPLASIADRILSANAYLGAFPLADALDAGADVVVTGRCADAALALAPAIHAFRWRKKDHDLLAAGMVAGHIIECGAQATGGNFLGDWQALENLEEIGYPIVEMERDGSFVVTKHPGTGGRVDAHTVKEQLVYEIGDPRAYHGPDCVSDFTSVRVEDIGPDRVRVSGARGSAPSGFLKVSINYSSGWKTVGTLVFAAPDAIAKARETDRIVRARVERLGLRFDEIYTELLGVNACHGHAAPHVDEVPEVQLRIGVRGQDRAAVDRFSRELTALVLSGPPGATGYGEGRPVVREVVAYWPSLILGSEIQPRVEVIE